MEVDRISQFLRNLTFRQAIWLFPFAFSLDVLEEWRQFTAWAMRYASDHFSRHDYIAIHVAGIITAFPSALLIRGLPYRWLIWGLLRFRLHSGCLLQRALSCRHNSDVWCVLPRFANGADGLSAVVLFSEPTGLS
jgi:hypothetical protein